MEVVAYEHRVEDALLRNKRLRRACMAFLAEPSSRRDLQFIFLLVEVPTLCDVPIAASPAPVPPPNSSRLPGAGNKDFAKSRRMQKCRNYEQEQVAHGCVQLCEARLRQSRKDARALSQWIDDYYSLSCRGRQVAVHVMAQLVPREVEDLSLYLQWQRSMDRNSFSPLRHADCLLLSFCSPKLLAGWDSPKQQLLQRKLQLEELLLDHQSLFLDLTNCVATPSKVGRPRSGPSTGAESFLKEIQPRLILPKGRVAFYISYHSFLHRCFMQHEIRDDHITSARHRDDCNFLDLHTQLRMLYCGIFNSPGSLGYTSTLRLCTAFGGPVEALQELLVAVPAPPQRLVGKDNSPAVDGAPLLLTRAQRDVYALLSVLVGLDQVNLFSAAHAFFKGVSRRLDAAKRLYRSLCASDMVLNDKGLLSVEVPKPDSSGTPGPTGLCMRANRRTQRAKRLRPSLENACSDSRDHSKRSKIRYDSITMNMTAEPSTGVAALSWHEELDI